MNTARESQINREESATPAIPSALLSRPQWIAWWSVVGEGRRVQLPNGRWTEVLKAQSKPHKLPINPRTGGLAATTRSSTWSSVEDALAAVQRWSLTGIGFVFTDSDAYGGVDLDNCRDPVTGEIYEWAWVIIRALDSYTEASPSGTGVHSIVCGKIPAGQGNQIRHCGGKIEIFSRARYFTFTGLHVHGTPIEILDRQAELSALHNQLFASRKTPKTEKSSTPSPLLSTNDDELIARASKARNGSKFNRLWKGEWEGDYPSQSEADLALCCLLAFWTGKDGPRMDRLFRRSGMMRKKWLRKGYREETISRAVQCTDRTWTLEGAIRPTSGAPDTATQCQSDRANSGLHHGAPEWKSPVPFHQFHLQQFPADVFPKWLEKFVNAEANATQTPIDLASMLALSVIAAACAKKVVVQIKDGYFEPVNIFTVTALPSGSRKTAVFTAITKPLAEYEQSETKRSAAEVAQKQTIYKIKEARLKKLQQQAGNESGKKEEKTTQDAVVLAGDLARMVVPAPVRCIVDDCTPEKLPGLLGSNGGRIAVMSPEGDVFDLMGGKYSANKTDNFAVFLKGHAGDDLRVDRVGRSPEFVKAPALTMGLAVQPDVIRGLAGKPRFRGRGLLGRFLYSLPPSQLGHRDTDAPPLPDDIRRNYHENILALLHLPFRRDASDEPCAHVLTLDFAARESLRNFAAWIEPQLLEFGDMGRMTDWGGKLVGAVGRIAGILHMAHLADTAAPWDEEISLATVEGAIRIGNYLIPHAKAAFAEMGADESLEKAKLILRWIKHKGINYFTRRDLHQALRAAFRRVPDLDSPLALLASQEFIRKRLEEAHDGPGRPPSPAYDVNPIWASQNFEYFEDCEEASSVTNQESAQVASYVGLD